MIWIVIALLTGVAALSVLVPLARKRPLAGRADATRTFYEQQIQEIEVERQRGLLNDDEYAAAKAEAARRLIAAHGQAEPQQQNSLTNRRIAALVAIVLVPAAALGLYAKIGQPALHDRPLEARLNAPPGKIELVAAVAKIERHLRNKPQDGRGWQVIAPVYMRMKRYDDAAKAWAKALSLLGPSAERYGALGESLFFSAKGKVTPDALAAFDRALAIDPNFNQALFFTGVAAEQSGDKQAARERWGKLITAAPPGAPWVRIVRQRLAALGEPTAAGKNAGNDKVQSAPPKTGDGSQRGPQSAAGRSISALPEAEQTAAIRGMVAGLAARLKDNGKDINGWLMLIRAYGVLKEMDKAVDALKQARAIFSGDTSAMKMLAAQARDAGIEASQ